MACRTVPRDWALQVDQLTVVMLLVVSFVGMPIHIYLDCQAIWGIKRAATTASSVHLNLFMFFMLTLVLAARI